MSQVVVFKNIKPRQRVYYSDQFGKMRSGKANPLLLFPDHVVIDIGNGRPVVVNDDNYMTNGV